MKIETRFNIGSTIWYASTQTKETYIECPDCNGTGIWTAETANGPKEIRCGGCLGRPHDFSLAVHRVEGDVIQLTVGRIETVVTTKAQRTGIAINILDANEAEPRDVTIEESYMAFETGIGSGSVYRGDRVFATEEEALARGEELAADIQEQIETRERVEKVEKDRDEIDRLKADNT